VLARGSGRAEVAVNAASRRSTAMSRKLPAPDDGSNSRQVFSGLSAVAGEIEQRTRAERHRPGGGRLRDGQTGGEGRSAGPFSGPRAKHLIGAHG
jgi:hypothetical protein